MTQALSAFAIPELAKNLCGSAVIIVDLLRASTTIAAALYNGASEILPVQSPQAALALRQPGDLLGGERNGLLIPGFDLANSPREYTRERIAGKRIIFTTTNGTRAIYHARDAGASIITSGSLSNLSALSVYLATLDLPINIICAGTGGKITMEDCLAAGAFLDRLTSDSARTLHTLSGDDQTLLMLKLWHAESTSHGRLLEAISASNGGRNLIRLGLEADIPACARVDACSVVPVFDARTQSLKAAV